MKFVSAFVISSTLLSALTVAQAETTYDSLFERSAHLMRVGNWRQASAVSQRLLALPNLPKAQRVSASANLCVAETKLEHLSEAAYACNQSIALAPDYWVNYLNRGNLRSMSGDLLRAKSDYARAKELNVANPTPNTEGVGEMTAPFVALGPLTTTTQEASVP